MASIPTSPKDCSVPAPLDSPPPSRPPSSSRQNNRPRLSRPPTPGGGPLSSHPAHDSTTSTTTGTSIPGTWPPTPETERASIHKTSIDTYGISKSIAADSLHSPLTPSTTTTTAAAAAAATAPPIMEHSHSYQQRAPVRRLFSLTSLRQSFSSSRASLSQRPDTSHGSYQAAAGAPAPAPAPSSSYQHLFSSSSSSSYRAQSPSLMSTTTSCMAPPPSSRFSHEPHPRPSTASAATATTSTSALLRKKRSSTWFNSVKRKSQIFGMSAAAAEDAGNLDVLDENGPEHKRFKDHPMPTLPEIDALSGGSLAGGSLGWDEQLFKRS